MKRILAGYNAAVGDTGLFISHPGKDIDDTTAPYMLDSRYRNMDIHVKGRVTMGQQSSSVGVGAQTVYYTAVSIPDLGYMPQFYGNLIYASSNSAGIPVNTSYWPSSGVADEIWSSSNFNTLNVGVWMPNRTTICAQLNVTPYTVSGTIQLYYLIFKNAENS